MNKIIDYVLVRNDSNRTIAEAVVNYIERGWQPYGNPFSSPNSRYQAMVKYEQEPKEDIAQMMNRQAERNAREKKLYRSDVDKVFADRIKETPNWQGGNPMYASKAWQFHLQQMVIADDPIQYLGENI